MVSLSAIAVEILNTGDAEKKVKRTFEAEALWEAGEISSVGVCTVPDVPAAPIGVEMVDPWKVARRKGGSEAKRIAALHSLCHIEQVAVNLSWDIIARFSEKEDLPKQFYDEWVRIAAEEAKHYTILAKRLKELGSYYGALPAHNGLWSSATETVYFCPLLPVHENFKLQAPSLRAKNGTAMVTASHDCFSSTVAIMRSLYFTVRQSCLSSGNRPHGPRSKRPRRSSFHRQAFP